MKKFYSVLISMLLLYGNLFAQITEPTAITIWAKGQKDVKIKWANPGSGTVTIELWRFTSLVQTIVPKTQNDGDYSMWDVPTNLTSASNYYLKMRSSTGWVNESERFTIEITSNTPPVVITSSAANITSSNATLRGEVNPNSRTTTYYFDYGTTAACGTKWAESSINAGTTSVKVSAFLSGLEPGRTYYYRLVASSSAGTSYGNVVSFKTANAVLQGSATITVKNVSSKDQSLPGANGTVKLYNKSNQLIATVKTNSSGVASFANIAYSDGYYCRIFHNPGTTLFGEEYWGQTNAFSITGSQSPAITFTRDQVYAGEVKFVLPETETDVTFQAIKPGTTVRIDHSIVNPAGASRSGRSRVVMDDYSTTGYDYNQTGAYQTIPANSTNKQSWVITPSGPGNYYVAAGAQTSLDGNATLTDGGPFGNTPHITIAGFTTLQPTTGQVVNKGDQVTIEWTAIGLPETTVALKYDIDQTFGNGNETTISSGNPLSGSAAWNTASAEANTYYIVAVINTSNGDIFQYAEGTVEITDNSEIAWSSRSNGLKGALVLSLASNETHIFAGTVGNGLFASSDNGSTWISVGPEKNTLITSIAISDNKIYAVTNNSILRSNDGGVTWNSSGILPGLGKLTINGSSLFLAAYSGRGYKSTNDGESWEEVNFGLSNPYISTFTSNGGYLFVGTYGSGVFISANDGESWTEANAGLANLNVSSFAATESVIYAATDGGVYKSTDIGANWTLLTGYFYANSIDVNGTTILVTVPNQGVIMSNDDGASWSLINTGLTSFIFRSTLVKDNNFFVGTDDGIFRYSNQSNTWSTTNDGLKYPSIQALVYDGENMYAGTWAGVFRSEDSGLTWNLVNSGLTTTRVEALAIQGGIIYAGTYQGGVFVSDDKGETWNNRNSGLTSLFSTNAFLVMGSSVFAATWDGIFITTDNGVHWTAANSGLTNKGVIALAANNNSIFAGTFFGGIFRSDDNGLNWISANSGLANTYILSLFANEGNVYAGTNKGLYISNDNGENWSFLGLSNQGVTEVTLIGGNLVIGTGNGLFMSADNGVTWEPINNGLEDLSIQSLITINNTLFAGTYTKGIWSSTSVVPLNKETAASRKTMSGTLDSESSKELSPKTPQILSVYPNPTQGEMTIILSIPGQEKEQRAALELMNTLGVSVKIPNTQILTAGLNEIKLDFTSVEGGKPAPGIYFIKLSHSGKVHYYRVIVD